MPEWARGVEAEVVGGERVGANRGDYIRGKTPLQETFLYLFRRLDINRGSYVQRSAISEILGKSAARFFPVYSIF